MELTEREKAVQIAKILDDKKAEDVKILEIGHLTSIGDYFVICKGTSNTHIKALCGEVEEKMKEIGVVPLHSEGYVSANWILMDYGSVIVHIFSKESHDFYDLERLWGDAVKIEY